MLLRQALATLLALGSTTALPTALTKPFFQRSVSFAFGSEKVRGLNIGGWLVLEPWITPSIFRSVDQSLGIVDELTLTQKLGSQAALEILRPHWDSWVRWEDFKKIADAGFNTVRIPIGYWAYSLDSGEPYTQGAAPYLDAAIDWARSTGLKIWIDLHGAPKSQNGFDNSGHRTTSPAWQQGDSVAQTLAVLQTITQKYAKPEYQDVVVAIELLNEPLGPALNLDVLKQFTRDSYGQVRAVSDTPVVFSDAFNTPSSWNNFLGGSDTDAYNAIIDHHEYQVFTNDLVAMSPAQHIQQVSTNAPSYGGSDKWVVVGEWTAAMTDCAPALNGYGIGARYDGTYPGSSVVGSCAGKSDITTWDEQFKSDTRAYIQAQIAAFEQQAGWIFWNFKTEGAHEWDAFKLLDNGIFPALYSSKPRTMSSTSSGQEKY
ncbi:glycoside hydrolase family 5 protein [Bisporella sp. PMI_857]|nr:glycoside hydrolase family 5 protein [Bisporella sp. PMI_857]